MNIDHHLQLSILQQLAGSNQAVKYSDLKDDTIENSLFSYHLNKLIHRKMIEKKDDGYGLTTEGARWLHDNGITMRPKDAPRVFVALVIENKKGEYLVGQRTGQFKLEINDYILPAHSYENRNNLDNQITNTINDFIPNEYLVKTTNYGFVQIKAQYEDGVAMRSLFCVTHCYTDEFELPEAERANDFEWLSWKAIEQLDHPSATILRGIIDYTRNEQNQHISPVIAG